MRNIFNDFLRYYFGWKGKFRKLLPTFHHHANFVVFAVTENNKDNENMAK